MILNKNSNEVKRFIETMEIYQNTGYEFFNLQTYIEREALYYKTRVIKGFNNNKKTLID